MSEVKTSFKKHLTPALITMLIVVVALFVYARLTKQVEIDSKGNEVADGKSYKTKLRFVSKKKAA